MTTTILPPGSVYRLSDVIAQEVTYPGHKGDTIHAYIARPKEEGVYPAIIQVPGHHGLEEHVKDVARRFAIHGYVCIAPGLHSRREFLGAEEEWQMKLTSQWTASNPHQQTDEDIEGALRFLQDHPMVNSDRIGLIGFCSGGNVALSYACYTKGIKCFVDCYSNNIRRSTEANPEPSIERVKDLSAPMLGLFGKEDTNPSPEDVEVLRQELIKHNKSFEIVSFDNASHAFFSDTRARYVPEVAQMAWGRMLEWFARYLKYS